MDNKIIMPRELTAENGAKALLNGEFFENHEVVNPDYCGCGECDYCKEFPDTENYITEKHTISWTSIKLIYDMAVKHLGKEINE